MYCVRRVFVDQSQPLGDPLPQTTKMLPNALMNRLQRPVARGRAGSRNTGYVYHEVIVAPKLVAIPSPLNAFLNPPVHVFRQ